MRYKVKKNLTVKKLGETENNILRIQDLLQELRDPVGSFIAPKPPKEIIYGAPKKLEANSRLTTLYAELIEIN